MNYKLISVLTAVVLIAACSSEKMPGGGGLPASLKEVPSVRLNFRYEADVPAPETTEKTGAEERNAAVQADFDQHRVEELVDRTVTSPDGKRVAVIYHRPLDLPNEFRLDMYTPDGKVLKKVTSDLMAVHFPDTIRWSPDSTSLAFLAMLRGASTEPTTDDPNKIELVPAATPVANANTNIDANAAQPADANVDANNAVAAAPTLEAPTGILTFRTEQLYLCDADGGGTKPVTQNEGFIYFYYVWAPDGSSLAALAAHAREWRELERRADAAGSVFVPLGRPRVIEKNGRERRLDDALTAVQPVWSPDSAKVAAAFEHQVRIYDALGNNPTQAAIPLRNQLLISSQAYDQAQAQQLNADANSPASNTNTAAPSTLPDPSTLVSFNPIVLLDWGSPDILNFETAYVKRMKNEADSATSFVRWHRLILTPQAAAK
ncbi:MAG TPA: hypothetical protein PLK77_02155 [Pyrinomonadaceae bacterium]|nr:hypothetical protein [Pyrinomonadaceae bacterium]